MRSRKEELDEELSSGCTAMVAVVRRGHLYLAHVGRCRALLCWQQAGDEADHRVRLLNSEHTCASPEERQRLTLLGLSPPEEGSLLTGNACTRCIGDHRGKGDYRHWPRLRHASAEPLITDPELACGLQVEGSWRYLILTTYGLCAALQEVLGSPEGVNAELVKLVIAEAKHRSNLHDLAQAVVDNIVRQHHQRFMKRDDGVRAPMHEDMTLLIRRFEAPPGSPSADTLPPSDCFSLPVDSPENSLPSGTTNSGSLGSRSEHTLSAYVDWAPWEAAWRGLSEEQQAAFRATLATPSGQACADREKIEEEEEGRSEAASAPPARTGPDCAPPAGESPALTATRPRQQSNDSSDGYAAGDV